MDYAKIAACKIYPSIGIARVGNSPEFFIGPEVPDLYVEPAGGYRDAAGRVKRQAARFRVFAFDASGSVLGECALSDRNVEITWTVSLANRKAAWHEFDGVIKGRATDDGSNPTPLRNANVSDRSSLEIVPTPCTIKGVLASGPKFHFDDGAFLNELVELGEVRTDELGRLLVLGGFGKSGHIKDAKPLSHYANNDGWQDDTADGSVTAEVTIAGQKINAAGAWVIVAPPDFAPAIDNLVTLYDVMRDAWAPPTVPATVSFSKDVYPIFARLDRYPWVNDMALRGHGPSKNGSFLTPGGLDRLRDGSPANQPFRSAVLARVRDPKQHSQAQANYNYMPLLSGDEGDCEEGKPDNWFYLLETQYTVLERWAQGKFVDDWPAPAPATDFDAIPLSEQPSALTAANLSRCVGGPFFPGIEITYIAREKSIYSDPFRFDHSKVQPGDITKRMAVPWQADFFECQIHWWPAQRPDYVLNEEVVEAAAKIFPEQQKEGNVDLALLQRQRWDRGVGQRLRFDHAEGERPALPGDNDMVSKWSSLGFVVPRTTDEGEQLYLETGRSHYDGLDDRDYFYLMLNLDSYPDFRPKAKELADGFLADAWHLTEIPAEEGGVDDYLRFFSYTAAAFAERMEEIYAIMLKTKLDAEKADPKDTSNPGNPRSIEEIVERVRQLAPFNQLDGAWLRNISRGGPIDEIDSLLFSIWMDEVGDGDPDENHANLYTKFMEELGIVLPPLQSREYSLNPDLLDSAFTTPVFELVISEFTRTYFPEILGMTLMLEWEVLNLWPGIIRLEAWGIDTHFYRMHVGIDNASNGHGAKARRAVELYLDRVRLQSGSEEEVQRQWKRIWNGYVAFETVGTFGSDFQALIEKRRSQTPETELIELVERKKAYGRFNHGEKTISKEFINDLFEDPQLLLSKLAEDSRYIVPGDPGASKFFDKLTFDGPMYKVFTEDEINLWRQWVLWLPTKPARPAPLPAPAPSPSQPPLAIGEKMAALIDTLRPVQAGTPAHARYRLVGPDSANPGQQVTLSVTEWFKQPTVQFMAALADPANKWIVPGDAAASRFLIELVGGTNAMADTFDEKVPGSTSETWKDVATKWIEGGCPIPAAPKRPFKTFAALLPKAFPREEAFRLTPYSSPGEKARHPRGKILGIGTVH